MDREVVLAILVALLCGSALTAAAWYPTGTPVAPTGRTLERRAWQRVWFPFGPAALLFAALCGWALVEPERAERVPACLLWAAVPFTVVLTRATWRAVRSLVRSRHDLTVATVGLFRPRMILAPGMATRLDERALAAACAHERAHARHRDPLRLWLAQLGSDLLWPWPAASARFACWRQALELARDEEARLDGIAGPDLATAILTTLRFQERHAPMNAAPLGGDAAFVAERVAYLMRPLRTQAVQTRTRTLWLVGVAAGVVAAVLLGTEFGERVVGTILATV